MWTVPSLEELEETLRDPKSPIGKRMRAAYYCKHLYSTSNGQTEEEEKKAKENDTKNNRIITLLCEQVLNKQHGSLLRHEFAYVLGQMQCIEACQTLEKLLLSSNDCVMVRHEAAEALGAIKSSSSMNSLESILAMGNENKNKTKHDDNNDTQEEEEEVGEQEMEMTIPNELIQTCYLALNRIKNPDDDTAVGCACMLAPYNSIDPTNADPKHEHLSTSQIGTILLDDTLDLIERYRAMFSLRNRGDIESVRQLCLALISDTSSPLLRHEVAYVLGQLQHPASIDALIESLSRNGNGSNDGNRSTGTADKIQEEKEHEKEHAMVRHEAAEALGAIECETHDQWKQIEETLLYYQKDDEIVVAESCIVALDAADYWGHDNKKSSATTTTATPTTDNTTNPIDVKNLLAEHFNVEKK